MSWMGRSETGLPVLTERMMSAFVLHCSAHAADARYIDYREPEVCGATAIAGLSNFV